VITDAKVPSSPSNNGIYIAIGDIKRTGRQKGLHAPVIGLLIIL
jgi:hypothetical protein